MITAQKHKRYYGKNALKGNKCPHHRGIQRIMEQILKLCAPLHFL